MEELANDRIKIGLPVKIHLRAVENLLQKKMKGEFISKASKDGTETRYAEILALTLENSIKKDYELALGMKVRVLMPPLKNRIMDLLVFAALEFEKENQVLKVSHYKVQGLGNSWLLNNSLELMANTLLHGLLKKTMNLELQPVVQREIKKLNTKLKNNIELHSGIFLQGSINDFVVREIVINGNYLLISVVLSGSAVAHLDNLDL